MILSGDIYIYMYLKIFEKNHCVRCNTVYDSKIQVLFLITENGSSFSGNGSQDDDFFSFFLLPSQNRSNRSNSNARDTRR